jgi:hypothetical protein
MSTFSDCDVLTRKALSTSLFLIHPRDMDDGVISKAGEALRHPDLREKVKE